ncbi:hypothetical protein D5086_013778 [Populus alba]|uniref:Uncharacterized protein n=1 Tax=Populus alba TaxID=43335 RepID=A0ACC4C6R5_POPAL
MSFCTLSIYAITTEENTAQGKERFRPRHIQAAGGAVHRKTKSPGCRLASTLSNLNTFNPEFSSVECFLAGFLAFTLEGAFLDREKFQRLICLMPTRR